MNRIVVNSSTSPMRIQEFARRTGTTVRALHHYDRLGLLRPPRTLSGYRLYGERELVRLQQITTLRFIGCSLKEIKAALSGPISCLEEVLALQHEALKRKRKMLDHALQAVERAQKLLAQTGKADWEALKQIIEVVQMEQNKEWMKKYFTPEQLAALHARRNADPEAIRRGEEAWAKLIPEVEAAAQMGLDPSSPGARTLAQRWTDLVRGFTGGDAGIQQGLNQLYADQQNWPQSWKRPYSETAGRFIHAAMEAHGLSCM
ncbi:MerR family transcriptional regulator [Pseudacidobacterium ailaaui]|jgi:DNA-binding transcriptional MerR regulator|uniref:MerR family transcriptional regulator n=1 Tax=Pseudacidobacterium ailaaui TaxID=1382359 RepID=UPI0005D2D1A5|nr:MerR family transcriptional regulator [Pseudacidobacterium ailaaui]